LAIIFPFNYSNYANYYYCQFFAAQLIIRNVSSADSGHYFCKANNTVGSDMKRISLYVQRKSTGGRV